MRALVIALAVFFSTQARADALDSFDGILALAKVNAGAAIALAGHTGANILNQITQNPKKARVPASQPKKLNRIHSPKPKS